MAEEQGKDDFLIPEDLFLTSGVHIGTQQKSADMQQFIFRVRNDGLYVLDIKQTNDRIRLAAAFLSQYPADKIVVVSARQYGQKPVRSFGKQVGVKVLAGRFVPGSLTNPKLPQFIEPDVIVVTDPSADGQALRESITTGIPVVGLCDANNETKYVDLVIPANNKGRRSLAVIYWLMAREILMNRETLKNRDDYELSIEDFEASL